MNKLPLLSVLLTVPACAGALEPESSGGSAESAAPRLTCTTPVRAQEDAAMAPRMTLEAVIPSAYRTGAELTSLSNARANAGRPGDDDARLGDVAKDATYRPRGENKNWNRFDVGGLDAVDESFDGIVHSVILPKVLGQADIVHSPEPNDSSTVFKALVASSTDSYHDGIISYFHMRCLLFPGTQGNDRLSCSSRSDSSSDDFGPSFALSASAVIVGGELTTLNHVSASAAQQRPTEFASMAKDEHYRPQTDADRNRFNFPGEIEATDDGFDGIAHGLILEKKVTANQRKLKGYLISSTDSYHDGIMSYFVMDCSLSR